jgi:hypothetical protein
MSCMMAGSGWQPYLLLAVTAAASFAVLGLPRDVAPVELPALVLRPEQVRAQEHVDSQLLAAAPKTPAAEALLHAYREYGLHEATLIDNARALNAQRRSLQLAYDRVLSESGPRAGLALRAFALGKLEDALEGRIQGDDVRAWLGVFPNVLIQHLATRDGLELAPHFVIRTLYKARWNRVMDHAAETDFSQVERQAYFGWLGLHAYTLPMMQRRAALLGYAAAGGDHAAEAQGVLAFLDHDFPHAVESLELARQQNPSFRIRNYLRGARAVAAELGPKSANLSHEAQHSAQR